MRDTIIVKVSELRAVIQDVRRTGSEYVELTISDSYNDNDEVVPASLSLCTCDSDECMEFDPIYAPENESELSADMDEAIHMSSNLF